MAPPNAPRLIAAALLFAFRLSAAAPAPLALGDGAVTITPAFSGPPRYRETPCTARQLEPGLHYVRCTFVPAFGHLARNLSLRLQFQPGRPDLWAAARKDFHWIPNIKSQPEHVAGDHVFRSPAVIVMAGGTGVALVPDLDALARRRPVSQYLDLQFPDNAPPLIEFGYADTQPDGHVYYRRTGRSWQVTEPETVGAYLIVQQGTTREKLLERVSVLLWDTYGRRYTRDIRPQTAPYRTIAGYGYTMALRDLWVDGPQPGTGGITLTTHVDDKVRYRGREHAWSLWYHSWFNNLRTAWGMYQWGKRTGNPEWMERARAVARLLVLAPRESGLFPIIYIPEGRRWQSSGQGGAAGSYHLADNAWAAMWLMRFHLECERIPGADAMLVEFARALIRLQHPDGGFPSRVREKTLAPEPTLDRSAESALPLWYLGEMLHRGLLPPEDAERARQGLRRGLAFLRREVLAPQRFEDFEVFFSCSRKPPGFFDPQTQLYGQGTLALQWCAEAFRIGYLLDRNPQELADGRFCLNLMNLYQQVWVPPYLSFYSFGGYGVLNTDGEWNDARQAQFSETNANFFDATGEPRFLERAVAAARASFALVVMDENREVAPRNYQGTPYNHEVHGASAENYGHGGRDERSFQSGFHWGTGSALTTAAVLLNRYGSLYVDPSKGWALGIDGLAATLDASGPELQLTVSALPGTEEISGTLAGGAKQALRINGIAATPAAGGRFEVRVR